MKKQIVVIGILLIYSMLPLYAQDNPAYTQNNPVQSVESPLVHLPNRWELQVEWTNPQEDRYNRLYTIPFPFAVSSEIPFSPKLERRIYSRIRSLNRLNHISIRSLSLEITQLQWKLQIIPAAYVVDEIDLVPYLPEGMQFTLLEGSTIPYFDHRIDVSGILINVRGYFTNEESMNMNVSAAVQDPLGESFGVNAALDLATLSERVIDIFSQLRALISEQQEAIDNLNTVLEEQQAAIDQLRRDQ